MSIWERARCLFGPEAQLAPCTTPTSRPNSVWRLFIWLSCYELLFTKPTQPTSVELRAVGLTLQNIFKNFSSKTFQNRPTSFLVYHIHSLVYDLELIISTIFKYFTRILIHFIILENILKITQILNAWLSINYKY